jgi:hypothetical protein
MELVKPREQFFEPDPRCDSFASVDATTGEWRRMTLDDYYKSIEDFSLNSAVPEEIVSYVNMVKMLFLNGWLYYPFFATCESLGAMAVEMALRLRLPAPAGKRDRRGLKELLTVAVQSGILRDSGFPSLPYRRAEAESFHKVARRRRWRENTAIHDVVCGSTDEESPSGSQSFCPSRKSLDHHAGDGRRRYLRGNRSDQPALA